MASLPRAKLPRRRLRHALTAATLAMAAGVGGYGMEHFRTQRALPRQHEQVRIERLSREEMDARTDALKREKILWSVFNETRSGNGKTNTHEFDRRIDEEMRKWKKAMEGEARARENQEGFAENTPDQNLNKILNLSEAEIRAQIKLQYGRNPAQLEKYTEYALSAKKQLQSYFEQRAQRITEESRRTQTAWEKEQLTKLAKHAHESAKRVGGISAGGALLAYSIILGSFAIKRILDAKSRKN